MPNTPAPPNRSTSGTHCPMCDDLLKAGDRIITCSSCGREGCTETCIPGGNGTECVECEEAEDA